MSISRRTKRHWSDVGSTDQVDIHSVSKLAAGLWQVWCVGLARVQSHFLVTARLTAPRAAVFTVCIVSLMMIDLAFAQVAALVEPPTVATFDRVGSSLPDGWRVIKGNWRIADGAMVADSLEGESYLTFGKSDWQNYEISASVAFQKIRDPKRWLSILFRATADGEKPWSQFAVRFDAKQNNGTEFAVRTPSNSWSVRSKGSAHAKFKLQEPRQVRVVVRGTHVQGYLDGSLVVDSHLCVDRSHGCVGLGVSGCVATFDDVSIRHLAASTVTPTSTSNSCDNVAHRGFSSVAPENTLAAIREAVKAGATGCEFDVYACADGTVVLMHDETVDRTTNGRGKVTELSLRQLQTLDAGSWKGEKYRDERVPTLIDALTLLKDTKCQPVIEIKMEGIAQKVIDDVRSVGMVEQVAVIAFSQSVVGEIRKSEPKMLSAWLCGGIPAEAKASTVGLQADWLHAQAQACDASVLDLHYGMLSPELVAELKRRGLLVWCWTVNEPAVVRALSDWGVNSITTDRPDLLRPSINQ